jgi:FkbM family methyltransferase
VAIAVTEELEEVAVDTDPVPDELLDGEIVLEAGAYEGAWAKKVCEQRPNCEVWAFEPSTRAYRVARKRLAVYDKVFLINVALGKRNGAALLYDRNRDGANTFVEVEGEPAEHVCVVDVEEIVRDFGEVALAHLNAEGGEIEILERLMDTGLIGRVRMIMTQWHPYDAATSTRIERAIERLAETHYQDNRYYAWNFWMRKDDDA